MNSQQINAKQELRRLNRELKALESRHAKQCKVYGKLKEALQGKIQQQEVWAFLDSLSIGSYYLSRPDKTTPGLLFQLKNAQQPMAGVIELEVVFAGQSWSYTFVGNMTEGLDSGGVRITTDLVEVPPRIINEVLPLYVENLTLTETILQKLMTIHDKHNRRKS